MAIRLRLLVALLVISFAAPAQLRVVKPVKPAKKSRMTVTKLGLGIGRSRSVLFLNRNIKQDNDAHGWNATMVYGLNRVIRVSAEYTWYKPISIRPTWYDVNAHSIEVNLNFQSSMVNANAKFYPIAGISFNVFEGFFTGAYDHLNLRALYEPNTTVRTRWVGLNTGVGIEQYIKAFSLFGEFKMRIGVSEGYNHLSIMDVCLSMGVRYNIRVPALHRIFDGTRSRYLLDVQEKD